MSPRWNKVVRLCITPVAIEVRLEAGWPRRASLGAVSQAGNAFDPPRERADEARGAPTTADRASLVQFALDGVAPQGTLKGSRLHAVLDDELVHVDVVKGDFAGLGDSALDRIAQACVAEMLGDGAATQVVRWSLQPDEKHLAICAVSAEDAGVLSEAATLRKMRLASLQSSFALCWNLHARQRRIKAMVFVVATGLHAVVACVVDRSICALSAGPWKRASKVEGHGTPPAAAASFDNIHTIDGRVEQLLACLGLDPDAMGAFVAVLPAGLSVSLLPRWARIDAPAYIA